MTDRTLRETIKYLIALYTETWEACHCGNLRVRCERHLLIGNLVDDLHAALSQTEEVKEPVQTVYKELSKDEQRLHLLAECNQVRRFIAQTPIENVIDRLSWKNRLKKLEEDIQELG